MRTMPWGLAAVLLCLANVARALAPIPAPTGYLTDQVMVIEPQTQVQVQMRLARYEATTGRKLVVLLVPETPGEELEQYADRVIAAWKIDQASAGGALLLWSAEGYVLVRATGPVLDRLTGPVQSDILSRWVVPAFAAGDAGAGIRNGVERMIAVLEGGEVGFPDAVAEARRESDPPAINEQGDRVEQIFVEPAPPLPAVFRDLPEDVERLAQGFSSGFVDGASAWGREAGQQLEDLPVVSRALLLQAGGEQVQPPFDSIRIAALYGLGAVVLVAAIMLGRGAPTAALFAAGTLGGAAFWVATGFTALAGLVMVVGLAAPGLVPALRTLLRGADDSERDPEPPRWPVPASPARPSRIARPTVPSAQPVRPHALAGSTPPRPIQLRFQQLDPNLVRQIQTLAKAELRQLKPGHALAAFVLLILVPPLAVLGALGYTLYKAYRSGIAYLLVELLIIEPPVRQRLQQRLPRPTKGGST